MLTWINNKFKRKLTKNDKNALFLENVSKLARKGQADIYLGQFKTLQKLISEDKHVYLLSVNRIETKALPISIDHYFKTK